MPKEERRGDRAPHHTTACRIGSLAISSYPTDDPCGMCTHTITPHSTMNPPPSPRAPLQDYQPRPGVWNRPAFAIRVRPSGVPESEAYAQVTLVVKVCVRVGDGCPPS